MFFVLISTKCVRSHSNVEGWYTHLECHFMKMYNCFLFLFKRSCVAYWTIVSELCLTRRQSLNLYEIVMPTASQWSPIDPMGDGGITWNVIQYVCNEQYNRVHEKISSKWRKAMWQIAAWSWEKIILSKMVEPNTLAGVYECVLDVYIQRVSVVTTVTATIIWQFNRNMCALHLQVTEYTRSVCLFPEWNAHSFTDGSHTTRTAIILVVHKKRRYHTMR